MQLKFRTTTAALIVLVLTAACCWGQAPGVRRPGGTRSKEDEAKKAPPPRPTDPLLLELHKEFVSKAEKLAAEFEAKKQHEKAREVHEALLRLLPEYPPAVQGLQRAITAQASRDRMVVDVQANKAWQDSGVVLQAGSPVHIEAQGIWQLGFVTGPVGIQIPKEARPKKGGDFELGSLIGVIVGNGDPEDLEPFLIGEGKDFIAETSGRLFLRMYDVDPQDNRGKMTVLIQSTFVKGN